MYVTIVVEKFSSVTFFMHTMRKTKLVSCHLPVRCTITGSVGFCDMKELITEIIIEYKGNAPASSNSISGNSCTPVGSHLPPTPVPTQIHGSQPRQNRKTKTEDNKP
jgi:hypothetical protein